MNPAEKRKRTWRIKRVQKMAEEAVPLGPVAHAGPGRGLKLKPKDRVQSGNRSQYLMARIARDRPDVLERAKAGEFVSVRQAAIAAGIVKGKEQQDPQGSSREARQGATGLPTRRFCAPAQADAWGMAEHMAMGIQI